MFFDVQIQSSVKMVDFGTFGTRMLKIRTVYIRRCNLLTSNLMFSTNINVYTFSRFLYFNVVG
jgi:hypothetical protein